MLQSSKMSSFLKFFDKKKIDFPLTPDYKISLKKKIIPASKKIYHILIRKILLSIAIHRSDNRGLASLDHQVGLGPLHVLPLYTLASLRCGCCECTIIYFCILLSYLLLATREACDTQLRNVFECTLTIIIHFITIFIVGI